MGWHEIDQVVAVTGHPSAEMEGESLARALVRFSSGTVAVFDALWAGSFIGLGEEFRLTGTQIEDFSSSLVEMTAHYVLGKSGYCK